MHKNRFYTFLLTHTTKERIYIRRIEVSRKLAHSSVATAFLLFVISFAGVFGLMNSNFVSVLAEAASADSTASTGIKPQNIVGLVGDSNKPLDYSRPVSTEDLAENSGGPNTGSYQLSAESDGEERTIEQRLRQIEAESNPRNLPTIWSHLGKINNEFGFRRNPFGGRSYEFHSGMDIDGDKGDMVVAPANGKVVKAGWHGGYGYLIEIDHGNGLKTRYGHLSKVGVKEGDEVQRGQLIALIGSTGRSTGPHLHYELRLNDKAVNPRRFLPPEPSALG